MLRTFESAIFKGFQSLQTGILPCKDNKDTYNEDMMESQFRFQGKDEVL